MQSNNLKLNITYPPGANFRYEGNVVIGNVEMHAGGYIGFATYMNSGFVRSSVHIGRYCSIGRNVTLGSGAHDYQAVSTSPFFKNNSNGTILKFADAEKRIRVKIGHDVWIGDNSYVMSGVTIGNGSIIAAGSIVTKNVGDYEIYAGVPARHIKYRFDHGVMEKLRNIQWWDLDPNLIKNLDISNIEEFIAHVNEAKKDFFEYKLKFLNLVEHICLQN